MDIHWGWMLVGAWVAAAAVVYLYAFFKRPTDDDYDDWG